MNIRKELYGFTRQRRKEEIFLVGFHVSLLIILILAIILDISIENLQDAYIEVGIVLVVALSLVDYLYRRNTTRTAYAVVFIVTLSSYLFLITSTFRIPVFHIIVPLAYFLLFSLKRALLLTLLHESIVITLYYTAFLNTTIPSPFLDPMLLAATLLSSLLIIFFGIVYHIAVENSYALLKYADRQKAFLLKEVHHRVKNNLNIVSSILGLQIHREPYLQEVLAKNRTRIDTIAMIHEMLYKHDNIEHIDIRDYLHKLAKMLLDISQTHASVHIENTKLMMPFETVLKLGMISNELILNSIKYAFVEKIGHINIEIQEHTEHYTYIYSDNLSQKVELDDNALEHGLGLKLISALVTQMDGHLKMEHHAGLIYHIEVPKDV